MKLVTSEQLKINRESKNYEVLQKLHNTIDLKDYYAKIKSRVDASLSTKSLPDYYVLKKQFNLPEYQATFSNKSVRFSIRTYINLLNSNFSTIKPIHISKNIILNKIDKKDVLNQGFEKKYFRFNDKNAINLKDYIVLVYD
jgi:hypothetical protein